ncbi:MAG: hypothetical protein AB1942_04180 [Pseudomonadota bacterium]
MRAYDAANDHHDFEDADDDDATSACKVGLTPTENLLFAALRGWASARIGGARPHPAVTSALARRTSPRSASLFIAWAQAVEKVSRRPLQLTCPGCGGVSTDAQRLIVACGVAPVDPMIAEALLNPILRDPTAVVLLGRSLNASLAADGWRLPVRLAEDQAHSSSPQPVTRH